MVVRLLPTEKRSDTSLQSEQNSFSPLSFLCALLSRFSCWQHPTPTAMSVNHLQSASPIATNRTSSCLTSGHTVQYNVDALVVSTFFFVLFPPTCLHDSADYKNHYPENRLAITTLRTFDTRSAQSNIVIVRFQSYAPTLRCRCVVTTRLHPFGKGNDFLPTPHGQRTLLQQALCTLL